MASFIGLLQRWYKIANPPKAPLSTESTPLRFGILGAANIAPSALIGPAVSHPEVIVYAVAARSLDKAQRYAKKHGIEKVYGGPEAYQELLNDPNIDAIYNPLPNGLHYEWTLKALQAGKHVLLEKPSCDTAAETRELFDVAQAKGLVLLEAFHYRFHPATQRVKAIVESGELGKLTHAEATMQVPKGLFADDDIRLNYDLGGGAMMDMGCYPLNALRYVIGSNPTSVIAATPDVLPADAKIDAGMSTTLAFPADVTGTARCHLRAPLSQGLLPKMTLEVKGEKGTLRMFNFAMPTIYHWIEVSVRDEQGRERKRTEKVYKSESVKGEEWWTTYRYQLEAFVDKVKGRTPTNGWLDAEDSVANMEWIEKVYDKSGLGVRPKSTFKLPVLQ